MKTTDCERLSTMYKEYVVLVAAYSECCAMLDAMQSSANHAQETERQKRLDAGIRLLEKTKREIASQKGKLRAAIARAAYYGQLDAIHE
jgi:hypothetical protein